MTALQAVMRPGQPSAKCCCSIWQRKGPGTDQVQLLTKERADVGRTRSRVGDPAVLAPQVQLVGLGLVTLGAQRAEASNVVLQAPAFAHRPDVISLPKVAFDGLLQHGICAAAHGDSTFHQGRHPLGTPRQGLDPHKHRVSVEIAQLAHSFFERVQLPAHLEQINRSHRVCNGDIGVVGVTNRVTKRTSCKHAPVDAASVRN